MPRVRSRAEREDGDKVERTKTLGVLILAAPPLLSTRIMSFAPTPKALLPRQIWAEPSTTSGDLPHSCTPFRLPSGGEINIGGGTIITLTQDAGFQPICGSTPVPSPIDPQQTGADLSVLDHQDPFYSSTSPQLYAISAVTVVSYMLLIILFITPRTYFVGGAGGGGGFLGQRGTISGAYGSNPVIGIGSRPWLQKIAALTVAVSMTIVTADTFKWAERQYDAGYQDANELTENVISSLEVRVVRTLSETFLWLAQAQTLIRLFPRHKEKLMIKWIAFALIVLELIFSSLNHFLVEDSSHRPKRFVNAIPAMNYLFALTLNLCYGGFIIFYALQKRRFAFYHPYMKNMPLVALLSLTAVLIPVVFFVLDLSQPNVAGWGSYVRWVGAAAASVVVWEWVERIEALERDEKKDGILGREIFDGDEMLDATPSSSTNWPNSRRKSNGGRGGIRPGGGLSTGWNVMTTRARKLGGSPLPLLRGAFRPAQAINLAPRKEAKTTNPRDHTDNNLPVPPPLVASPVSRTEMTSAGSTVYVVRNCQEAESTGLTSEDDEMGQQNTILQDPNERHILGRHYVEPRPRRVSLREALQKIPNPFGRQRNTPPPEVARALTANGEVPMVYSRSERKTLLQRLHIKKVTYVPDDSPAIVIPARPTRPWSPDEYEYFPESEEGPTDRSQPMTDGYTAALDADRPPEAVLNALRNSQSLSPTVNGCESSSSTSDIPGPITSTIADNQGTTPSGPPPGAAPEHSTPAVVFTDTPPIYSRSGPVRQTPGSGY